MNDFTTLDIIQLVLLLASSSLLLFLYGGSVIVTLSHNYREYKRKRGKE